MIDAVVYRQNHVPERQRAYQASHSPVYFRPPRSKLYLGAYFTLFGVGMCGTVYGIYQLTMGKPVRK
ncbi:hypothetical protein M405DRAFT_862459 [Rhizopogon salebrosus TDB-379]|nr:hypothetical protein M405DRAFT_862459 [Rhizopogon salebrosus TDB-379]